MIIILDELYRMQLNSLNFMKIVTAIIQRTLLDKS